jgi:hypothetical protein
MASFGPALMLLALRCTQAQCCAAMEALERLHASTGQLLQSVRGALDDVQKAHGTWQHLLTAQSNRCCPTHSTPHPYPHMSPVQATIVPLNPPTHHAMHLYFTCLPTHHAMHLLAHHATNQAVAQHQHTTNRPTHAPSSLLA